MPEKNKKIINAPEKKYSIEFHTTALHYNIYWTGACDVTGLTSANNIASYITSAPGTCTSANHRASSFTSAPRPRRKKILQFYLNYLLQIILDGEK